MNARKVLFIIISIPLLFSCNQKIKTQSKSSIPTKDKIAIYKETDSILDATESIVEAKYPYDVEKNLGQKRPDSLAIRQKFDSLYSVYKAFQNNFDDSLFSIITNKYHISKGCLDSIWFEGAQKNWQNL